MSTQLFIGVGRLLIWLNVQKGLSKMEETMVKRLTFEVTLWFGGLYFFEELFELCVVDERVQLSSAIKVQSIVERICLL